jgi:uncharacterized protein YlaN (UPF0358 family)
MNDKTTCSGTIAEKGTCSKCGISPDATKINMNVCIRMRKCPRCGKEHLCNTNGPVHQECEIAYMNGAQRAMALAAQMGIIADSDSADILMRMEREEPKEEAASMDGPGVPPMDEKRTDVDCIKCGKPVGNSVFTVCDDCWNLDKPKIELMQHYIVFYKGIKSTECNNFTYDGRIHLSRQEKIKHTDELKVVEQSIAESNGFTGEW